MSRFFYPVHIGDKFKYVVIFSMNLDVTSYDSNLPTDAINLCQFVTCPLSEGSTSSTSRACHTLSDQHLTLIISPHPVQGGQQLNQSYIDQIPVYYWGLPLVCPTFFSLIRKNFTHPSINKDANVEVMFVSASGGNELGCLTAKLSNGVTTQTAVISWISGVVTVGLAAVMSILRVVGDENRVPPSGTGATDASAAQTTGPGGPTSGDAMFTTGHAGGASGTLHSSAATTTPVGHSGPPLGRIDPAILFLHFQSIASAGLLSLRYPAVYHGFTANFAWANFIIPFPGVRNAAVHMRKCTINSSNTRIPVVSPSMSSGIATYTSQLGIDEQDIFGIVFLVFLCACALLWGLHLLGYAILRIVTFCVGNQERKAVWEARRGRLTNLFSNNTLRLVCDYNLRVSCFLFAQKFTFSAGDSTEYPCDLRILSMDTTVHLGARRIPFR